MKAWAKRHRWLLAGLAVGLIGLVIRFYLFQQPINSDDTQYFSQAAQAQSLDGLGDATNSNGMRLAILAVPAIYSHAFFDSWFYAFYASVYTFAILSFASLFVFARVLSGPRVAVIAAAVWATSLVAISIDTRLTPDNLGTALALFGLALIGRVALRPDGAPPSRTRNLILASVGGGFLLWLAFGARESFFVFGGVGVGFGLVSKRRWHVLPAVIGGLLLGFLVELVVMNAVFGDPLIRWRTAFAYRASLATVQEGDGTAYSGYTAADLFTRYPALIADVSAPELVIHFVGLAAMIGWLVDFRNPRSLAKAGAGLAAYGFLAFGVAKLDPVVPIMREKLRYYATAAPLFYLATAEWIHAAIFKKVERGRLARWLDRPHRMIGAAALAAIAIVVNLVVSSRAPEFARNGNDAHWVATARVHDNAVAHGRAPLLYTDGRTARVTNILMARSGAWENGDLSVAFEPGAPPGYAYLDWKRLNANVRAVFDISGLTHDSYQLIEHHPLVIRAQRRAGTVDALWLGDRVDRQITRTADTFPAGWRVLCGDEKTFTEASAGPLACPGGGPVQLYSGDDAPWRAPTVEMLDGDQFVEVVVDATTEVRATMRAFLYWWPSGGAKAIRQHMGQVEVVPGVRRYAMWTYLPQPAGSYRVVLRTVAGPSIEDVAIYRLDRLPEDDVRAHGDPWPATPVHDPQLDAITAWIAADARAHDRPLVVYADRLTAATGRLTTTAAWSWEELPASGAPSRPGYVIVDRTRRAAAASWDAAARGSILLRSQEQRHQIDVVFAGDAPVDRARTELPLDFPAGWTRLHVTAKTVTPMGAQATFTLEDPDEEILHSGADFVWRPAGGDLPGDRLIEVVGAASDAARGGPLRIYLYWWPSGQKKEKFQVLMGEIPLGADPQRFHAWTYLPADAGAYRIALRAGAGVTVSELRGYVTERAPGDQLEKRGDPW